MKTATLVVDLHKAALRTRTGTGVVTLLAMLSLTVSSTIAYLVAGGTWMFYQRSLRVEDFGLIRDSSLFPTPHQAMLTWLILAIFACVFLVPTIFSLTAQAAVLGASGREKRLATLRLIGLSSGDVTRMTMLETAVQALIGIVLGGFISALLVPLFTHMSFQGKQIGASELFLPWWGYLAVAVVVFLLAIGASVAGMQRVRVEPLGVSRKAMPPALKYRGVVFFVIFTVFTVFMAMKTSLTSGLATMSFIAAIIAINVILINWFVPLVLQLLYRVLSWLPGTAHFVASQRIVADAKTTWRRSAPMAFFGVIAGYLVVSPFRDDGMFDAVREQPVLFLLFQDIATGGLLTLGFGFVLSAMAIFLGLSSQVFEQSSLTRSMHLMGVSRGFYFRTQLCETLGPIIFISLIGFALGGMIGGAMLATAVANVDVVFRFVLAGLFLGVGWLITLVAIAAVEPFRTRTLKDVQTHD